MLHHSRRGDHVHRGIDPTAGERDDEIQDAPRSARHAPPGACGAIILLPDRLQGDRDVIAHACRSRDGVDLEISLLREHTGRYFLRYRPGLHGEKEQLFPVPADEAYRYYADLEWLVNPRDAFPDGIPQSSVE